MLLNFRCDDVELFEPNSVLSDCSESKLLEGFYKENTMCKFSCEVGYLSLLETPEITCTESGEWKHGKGILSCRAICPTPVLTANMAVGFKCFNLVT